MRNRDLIVLVSDKTGFTRMDTEEVLKSLLETILESLEKGHKVRIKSFGTFGFSDLPERVMGGFKHLVGKKLPPRKIPKFWFHRPIHNKLTKFYE